MTEALWVTGDSLTTLRALPDACVDLIVTSPPFLALRSYLPADHPDKGHEIGQEATPGAFLDVLLDLTEELGRVLTPTGSLCVELGDTFSGSGGAGGDYGPDGMRDGQPKFRQGTPRWDGRPEGQVRTTTSDPAEVMASRPSGGAGWPQAKSLCLIPEMYRMALAYGVNPLTGRTTDPWRVRNVVRWCRPNPAPGALGDKFRPGTSEMVVACKSARRWFDLDAVREPFKHPDANVRNLGRGGPTTGLKGPNLDRGDLGAGNFGSSTAGAPPLDWWEIPTQPYRSAHYATFPAALVVRPVKAMCPSEVCTTCGEPRRRITETTNAIPAAAARHDEQQRRANTADSNAWRKATGDTSSDVRTLGWSDCGHGTYRPGRVLDPFAGSGTTLAVATGHGRDGIGIDLDHRNADLARDRIGPMFFAEHTADTLAAQLALDLEETAA